MTEKNWRIIEKANGLHVNIKLQITILHKPLTFYDQKNIKIEIELNTLLERMIEQNDTWLKEYNVIPHKVNTKGDKKREINRLVYNEKKHHCFKVSFNGPTVISSRDRSKISMSRERSIGQLVSIQTELFRN